MNVTINGRPRTVEPGRTIAAVVSDIGVFCAIGVCHGCLVTVNDVSDVRACQRVLREGDEVSTR
ncbi:MAG TPA: 2Fe-2S iron-sulfur cluster-binding protein [Kutzneria sp.]|jgi:sulfur carrier protein ThiS